jgi:transposase-like protein
MEEWREIEGYEGVYSVSNLGRVRRDSSDAAKTPNRLLTPGRLTSGACNVNLSRDSRPKTYLVHRLVAAAFLAPPACSRQRIHHIDGDRANNSAINLRWVTPAETSFMQVLRGTQKGRHYGRQGALTDAQVLAIRADHRAEKIVAQEYGIAPATVGQIRRRKTYTHLPPRAGDYVVQQKALRLTEAQVQHVRSDTRAISAIAKEIGCARTSVWAIKTQRSYAHVSDSADTAQQEPTTRAEEEPCPLNRIDVINDVALLRFPNGEVCRLDVADIPLVRAFKWAPRKSKSTSYVFTRQRDPDGRGDAHGGTSGTGRTDSRRSAAHRGSDRRG